MLDARRFLAAVADCCAACSKQLGCIAYTFNSSAHINKYGDKNCFLKKQGAGKTRQSNPGCISGGEYAMQGSYVNSFIEKAGSNQFVLFFC